METSPRREISPLIGDTKELKNYVINCSTFAHLFSLNTDPRLLQQILLKTCANESPVGLKNQLDVLAEATGIVVECSLGISKGLKNWVELRRRGRDARFEKLTQNYIDQWTLVMQLIIIGILQYTMALCKAQFQLHYSGTSPHCYFHIALMHILKLDAPEISPTDIQ